MKPSQPILPNAAPEGDFAFIYANATEPWLAYEVERDFLSQPRAFAILRLEIGVEGWFFFSDCIEEPSAAGLTWVSQPQWLLQWGFGARQLDICAQSVHFLGVYYQQAGAAYALMEAFHQHELGD